MTASRSGAWLILAIALCASGMRRAEADVTIQERIAVEGTGLMSMASMSGTSTTSISGKHARMENDLRMRSGFVRMLARGAGQTTEIVRLDDGTIYVLETNKKRYRQISVAARRAELAKAMAAQTQASNPMAFDDSRCDWSEPQLTVGKSGAKETFAGSAVRVLTGKPLAFRISSTTTDQACLYRPKSPPARATASLPWSASPICCA